MELKSTTVTNLDKRVQFPHVNREESRGTVCRETIISS